MFEIVKLGGVWQIWNVTCDGSMIVENAHRNMGFLGKHAGRGAKALLNALRAIKPAFSLGTDFSSVVLDSNLEQDANGFHVFDYAQLNDAGIDIGAYVAVIDFRLGSFVVFRGNIFMAERIADELDTYPGNPFLIRDLKGQKPAPIEPADIFKIIIPSPDTVRSKLLEYAQESSYGGYEQPNLHNLEEVENYVDTYCYPDLALKIP